MNLGLQWAACCLLTLFYFLGYTSAGTFIYCYTDKCAAEGCRKMNYYYVPIEKWRSHGAFALLPREGKHMDAVKFSSTGSAASYVNYREMQSMLIPRLLMFPFLAGHIILIVFWTPDNSKIMLALLAAYLLLSISARDVLIFPVLRRDVRRLKSYKYVIRDDKGNISDALSKMPQRWKINTLLDVFFFFGEAQICCGEQRNYLVCRLHDGTLMHVYLKEKFSEMPKPAVEGHDYYNPAITLWVDEIVITA